MYACGTGATQSIVPGGAQEGHAARTPGLSLMPLPSGLALKRTRVSSRSNSRSFLFARSRRTSPSLACGHPGSTLPPCQSLPAWCTSTAGTAAHAPRLGTLEAENLLLGQLASVSALGRNQWTRPGHKLAQLGQKLDLALCACACACACSGGDGRWEHWYLPASRCRGPARASRARCRSVQRGARDHGCPRLAAPAPAP